ncbi:hypothetical protein N007_10815 [Alicyclobacillus acidoterrestris ATCC 49025]|nr:hypothetical protein N007_10815 [Alicyclobacillus acidoterrestris ATCC 49025]
MADCLLLGYAVLPRQSATVPSQKNEFDKWGVAFLFAISIVLVFPLKNLEYDGLYSPRVWLLFVIAFALFILFAVHETNVKHPIMPFHLLLAPKPFFGTVMATLTNMAVTCSAVGICSYLINVEQVHFESLTKFFISFFAGAVLSGLVSAWLYDKFGPGFLGLLASLILIYVGYTWSHIGITASLITLSWQFGMLGMAFGVILVTGSLGGTLAAKDISQLASLSMGMQYFRNIFAAFASPIFGWAVLKYGANHYALLQSRFTYGSPFDTMESKQLVQYLTTLVGPNQAQVMARYVIASETQTQSLLFAYQGLFTILFVLGIAIFIASLGMTITGKGMVIAQEEDPLIGLIQANQ